MTKKTRILLFAAIFALFLLTGCGKSNTGRTYPKTLSELNGLRIGMLNGSIVDQISAREFPDSEVYYFNSDADLVAALVNNKIDFYMMDKIKSIGDMAYHSNITIIDEVVDTTPVGYVFRKNDAETAKLKEELNAFIKQSHEDGTLDRLYQKWCTTIDAVDSGETCEIFTNGTRGTVKYAACSNVPPFSYAVGGGYNGFDIEFINLFCKEYDYSLDLSATDFGGLIPAVVTGAADIGGCCVSITEERQQSVDFSDVYLQCEIVAFVIKEELKPNFFENIKTSFTRTFIVEDRWKLILDGIRVTLTIFISAAAVGTILGFAVFLICRNNQVLRRLFAAFSKIDSGLPVLVVLMIAYYIVFGKAGISGLMTAVITFSVSIMLSVFTLFNTSVKSIGRDQIEGGLSLGLTERETLFDIILPQAMPQFIPNYVSCLVAALKGTSIVGYIAVTDLTRVSDIIRSRTYDAFFPLIVTALIYLALVYGMIKIIEKFAGSKEPKRRTEEQIKKRFEE